MIGRHDVETGPATDESARTKAAEETESYVFPASFAQQRLWFLDQLEPGSAVYNISRVAAIQSHIEVAMFERSLRELTRRHEILRTSFRAQGGEPFQIIASRETLDFVFRDLSGMEDEPRSREMRQRIQDDTRRPFDLARGPLLRTTLLRLGDAEYRFVMSMHHIVSDGWSLGILFRELGELYDAFSRGEPSPLGALPIQYGDYAVWQRERMEGGALEEQIRYWRKQLAGAPALLELPTDHPRPAVQTFRGSRIRSTIAAELAGRVRAFSRREGVTLFMTLLAAFQTLLSRYSGQEDIVVGAPIAGRNRVETEGVIGLFANTLALRTDLSGNPTFREVLGRVRDVTLKGYTHQDVPFERIVEELQPRRTLSYGPIFQVFFGFENTPRGSWKSSGLTLSPSDAEGDVARADLGFFMREENGALPYMLEYNVDLFERETVEALANHFETLLAEAIGDPEQPISRLSLLTGAERDDILAASRGPADPPAPRRTIPEMFEESVRTGPDRVAVVCEGGSLTYAELNARSNRLAYALRERGVAPGALVAICVRRSVDMVAAILGVLKSGGAYVPVDPSYPKDRISYLLADSGAKLLLTDETSASRLPEGGPPRIFVGDGAAAESFPSTDPEPVAGPDDLAYAIYTSGSSGLPKGVLVRHAGVANLFSGTREELGFGPDDVWTNFHSFAFDLSVWELWGPLLHGGRLVIVPAETAQSPSDFARLLAAEGVTVLSQTPAAARRLADVRANPDSRAVQWRLRTMVCGGEALPGDLAAELVAWNVPLWNFYGPTEATVWTTIQDVGPTHCGRGFVPIGRPLANTAAYILDSDLAPVPNGVAGDLYLGGEGLARGYLRRPDLDSERFIEAAWAAPRSAGARLYRTGDRARRNRRGEIEFLGRDDHQVKLRGYRVELGEIETTLCEHPRVREAAVLLREDEPGDRRLVAYFAASDPGPSPSALRTFLADRLPEYMVPQVFVALDALPLNSNAKVDRRALPPPGGGRPELDQPFLAPRTPTEEMLAEIWRRLLAIDRVGTTDDFFELGGHSLKATQVIARVRDVFGVDLPLRCLFATPTLAGLAADIDKSIAETHGSREPPLVRVGRDRPLPLSFGQQRLWFLEQLEPGSTAYNISRTFRIRGKLDVAALRAAIEALCGRHESLRTTFVQSDGEPSQLISAPAAIPLEHRILAPAGGSPDETEIRRVVTEHSARPFDLTRGPLWRVLLLDVASDEYVLHLTIHHIVSDGWSLGVLFRELSLLYSSFRTGRAAALPELSIQYADYAVWQRDRLRGATLERLLGYWRSRLAGAPEVLTVPGATPERPEGRSRGASMSRAVPPGLSRSIDALSGREGTTRFTTMLAAFQILLSQKARGRDVVVGTDVANRDRVETERLIGFFVNLLAIRTDLSGNPTFREALARVREATLGAYEHRELPFERLVEELRPARRGGINPIVQALIVESPPGQTLTLPGLLVEKKAMPLESSRFDLALFVGHRENELVLTWLYDRDLFEAAAVDSLADRFERVLTGVVADPEVRLEDLEASLDDEKGQNGMEERRLGGPGRRLRGARRQSVQIGRAEEPEGEALRPGPRSPRALQAGAEEGDP